MTNRPSGDVDQLSPEITFEDGLKSGKAMLKKLNAQNN
jgi:hypothetical protein